MSDNDWWTAGHSEEDLDQTLIEEHNGSGWGMVASPNSNPGSSAMGLIGSLLSGLTCTTATSCWAVGDFDDNSSPLGPLIEHGSPTAG